MRKKSGLTLFIFALISFFILSVSSSSFAATKIKIALGGQQPNSIDPTTFASNDLINALVFENLVEFTPAGKISPMLATAWKYSPDGKAITFTLRKGVKFSTGSPFTSKDIVFSVERSMKTNMAIQDQLSPSQGFEGVTALDDYTVKFTFAKPNAQFLYQTCGMMYVISKTDFDKAGEKAYLAMPTGTAAYKFSAYKAGQYIDVVASDYYWRERPQVTEAHIVLAPEDSTRMSMLKAKEVDMITNTPWANVGEFEKAGYNVTKIVGPHAQALSFGMINPNTPWANLKVRQAINYCIDKDAIIRDIFKGVPTKLQWQHPSELGYDASLKPAYPYDPQKAKQLMKEAGYEKGFEFPVVMLSDVVGIKNVIDYLSSSLKQININLKVTMMNFGPEFFGKCREWHEDKNALINTFEEIGGPMNPDPVINLTNNFYGGKPRGVYNTPELDAVINKALVTVDTAQRGKLVKQAYKMIDKDLPMVQVLQTAYVYVGQKNVKLTPQTSLMNSAFSMLRGIKVN